MKFLVDAQLPRRIARRLNEVGHDSIHTLDLPDGNLTPDLRIIEIASEQGRVVISKDSDFVDSHYLRGKPEKLLLVSTGNVRNVVLDTLFEENLQEIITAFDTDGVVELTQFRLIVHG